LQNITPKLILEKKLLFLEFSKHNRSLTHMRQGGKRKELSAARGALCYVAVIKMGMSSASVARMLNISRAGVSLAARRGETIFQRNHELQTAVSDLRN
jgi:putative transposase